jgi:hypothetical protein
MTRLRPRIPRPLRSLLGGRWSFSGARRGRESNHMEQAPVPYGRLADSTVSRRSSMQTTKDRTGTGSGETMLNPVRMSGTELSGKQVIVANICATS